MGTNRHGGEVALVTGANKGLGREIARRLAAEGMTVYLGCRDGRLGYASERELRADGLDARFVRLDVTDAERVDAAVKKIDIEAGRLDVLVNNAGVAVDWDCPVTEMTAGPMRATYEVNVFGVVTVVHACLPLLRRSAAARVVNLSSPLGSLRLLSDPTSTVSRRLLAYNSSKAALNAVTLMYAHALRDEGIAVNAANPGLVGTDLNNFTPGQDRVRTVAIGAEVPVRLALHGPGGPTGLFYGDDNHAPGGIVPW